MGQQQLIIIVLCTITIGIAISVGILIFTTDAIQERRDAIMQDMIILASNARAHYFRPASMGGGNNSYNGYRIPKRLLSNENGSYICDIQYGGTIIEFTGSSVDDPADKITAQLDASKDKLTGWTYYNNFDYDEE
jgi:hypothetical protein